ncbi:tetratricopeptide repeat protein [Occallatibacter savannae]|uniref:tetratricopeptide repeat protein n=1 Tax=Occallatibacter savannae TaxID=1002691 RepID=UPI0013A555E3|nr:tetratricopeptide repeat protein [Occallatibacter savannae]
MICIFTLIFAGALRSNAQPTPSDAASAGKNRILLVLPFDNGTGQLNLEWIREAAPAILDARFSSAGFAPMSRPDRMYALDHLGLPQQFQPSRASALKLAQTLDVDSIVVGNYRLEGTSIVAEARVLNVPRLRMSDAVMARGEMKDLIAIFDSLAWRLTRVMDPAFSVAQETFLAAGANLRLDAFEQYIRGISEPDQQERQRHLKKSVELSPNFSPGWMALGREDFNAQKYEEAAASFARVSPNDPEALEASFYRGLSLLYFGAYPQAQEAFANVAKELPLAEVLNNEGVAVSRQGKDATSLFVQAAAADPNAADYHFNLAISLKRHGSTANAANELAQTLKLRPSDTEAQKLQAAWKAPGSPDAANDSETLERIIRTFDAGAFKQAAQVMDSMEAARLAALPAHARAVKLAARAKEYFNRGLLLEAERLYQSAVSDDTRLAEAHAGLATVRERTGDAASARKEANQALEIAPSADAYIVLGRLDIAENHVDEASREIGQALKLDPSSRAAQELNREIAARTGKRQ